MQKMVVKSIDEVKLNGVNGPYTKLKVDVGKVDPIWIPARGWAEGLKAGDEIEVEIKANRGKTGKIFYNVVGGKILKTNDSLDAVIARLDEIISLLKGSKPKVDSYMDLPSPDPESYAMDDGSFAPPDEEMEPA